MGLKQKRAFVIALPIKFVTLDLATESTNANTRSYVLSSDTETTSTAREHCLKGDRKGKTARCLLINGLPLEYHEKPALTPKRQA